MSGEDYTITKLKIRITPSLCIVHVHRKYHQFTYHKSNTGVVYSLASYLVCILR